MILENSYSRIHSPSTAAILYAPQEFSVLSTRRDVYSNATPTISAQLDSKYSNPFLYSLMTSDFFIAETLRTFATKLLDDSVNIPSSYSKLVDESLFDLI